MIIDFRASALGWRPCSRAARARWRKSFRSKVTSGCDVSTDCFEYNWLLFLLKTLGFLISQFSDLFLNHSGKQAETLKKIHVGKSWNQMGDFPLVHVWLPKAIHEWEHEHYWFWLILAYSGIMSLSKCLLLSMKQFVSINNLFLHNQYAQTKRDKKL